MKINYYAQQEKRVHAFSQRLKPTWNWVVNKPQGKLALGMTLYSNSAIVKYNLLQGKIGQRATFLCEWFLWFNKLLVK